jgi:hypothetical protein
MLSPLSSVFCLRRVCRIAWCLSPTLGPDKGIAASPPRESAGLLTEESTALRKLSPEYEPALEVAEAI